MAADISGTAGDEYMTHVVFIPSRCTGIKRADVINPDAAKHYLLFQSKYSQSYDK